MQLKTKKIRGIKFSFDNQKEFQSIYEDIFKNKDYKFEADSNSPFILDCGSHIGMSILYFKKLYPKAKIIGFEPNPETLKILRVNMKQNNLKDVKLVNAALADKKGKVIFYKAKKIKDIWKKDAWRWDEAALVKPMFYKPKKFEIIRVPATRLSSYMNKKVDLIKLDIEGMETRIIKEIETKLDRVGEIIMEFHGSKLNKSNNIENILSILDKHSFRYRIRQERRWIKRKSIRKTKTFFLMIYAKKFVSS